MMAHMNNVRNPILKFNSQQPCLAVLSVETIKKKKRNETKKEETHLVVVVVV